MADPRLFDTIQFRRLVRALFFRAKGRGMAA